MVLNLVPLEVAYPVVATRRSLSDLDCSYTILKKVRDGRYNPIF